jgi:hypothetical protein
VSLLLQKKSSKLYILPTQDSGGWVALQHYELLFTFAKAHFQISLVSVFIEKQLWAIDALEASIKTLNFNSNQTTLTNYYSDGGRNPSLTT